MEKEQAARRAAVAFFNAVGDDEGAAGFSARQTWATQKCGAVGVVWVEKLIVVKDKRACLLLSLLQEGKRALVTSKEPWRLFYFHTDERPGG